MEKYRGGRPKDGRNYFQKLKIMYAVDLVIVAEHLEELRGAMEEWNFSIRLEGKYIKQGKNCVYLGGNISENGLVEGVRRRMQTGTNAWRNIEGVGLRMDVTIFRN